MASVYVVASVVAPEVDREQVMPISGALGEEQATAIRMAGRRIR